jgi:hypothetical protein
MTGRNLKDNRNVIFTATDFVLWGRCRPPYQWAGLVSLNSAAASSCQLSSGDAHHFGAFMSPCWLFYRDCWAMAKFEVPLLAVAIALLATVWACSPPGVSSAVQIGKVTYVCLTINGRNQTMFTPVADKFSRLTVNACTLGGYVALSVTSQVFSICFCCLDAGSRFNWIACGCFVSVRRVHTEYDWRYP